MAPTFWFLTPPKGVTVHHPYFLGSRHLSYNMFPGCAIYAPNQLRSIFLFPAVSEQYWFWFGLQIFPWQYNHLLPRCFGGFIVTTSSSRLVHYFTIASPSYANLQNIIIHWLIHQSFTRIVAELWIHNSSTIRWLGHSIRSSKWLPIE